MLVDDKSLAVTVRKDAGTTPVAQFRVLRPSVGDHSYLAAFHLTLPPPPPPHPRFLLSSAVDSGIGILLLVGYTCCGCYVWMKTLLILLKLHLFRLLKLKDFTNLEDRNFCGIRKSPVFFENMEILEDFSRALNSNGSIGCSLEEDSTCMYTAFAFSRRIVAPDNKFAEEDDRSTRGRSTFLETRTPHNGLQRGTLSAALWTAMKAVLAGYGCHFPSPSRTVSADEVTANSPLNVCESRRRPINPFDTLNDYGRSINSGRTLASSKMTISTSQYRTPKHFALAGDLILLFIKDFCMDREPRTAWPTCETYNLDAKGYATQRPKRKRRKRPSTSEEFSKEFDNLPIDDDW
ncbi:hypothetical protein KM043_014793 [Ampulex compressa]|nr:hypothetical protein KM043_014793 [Ampulex compressa]